LTLTIAFRFMLALPLVVALHFEILCGPGWRLEFPHAGPIGDIQLKFRNRDLRSSFTSVLCVTLYNNLILFYSTRFCSNSIISFFFQMPRRLADQNENEEEEKAAAAAATAAGGAPLDRAV